MPRRPGTMDERRSRAAARERRSRAYLMVLVIVGVAALASIGYIASHAL